MLTTTPHLRTRRPSPTTVEYTVSTSPVLTLPLRLLLLTSLLLRVSVGLSVLLLLYSKFLLSSFAHPLHTYAITPAFFSNHYIWHTISQITTSHLGRLSSRLASSTPLLILAPFSLACINPFTTS